MILLVTYDLKGPTSSYGDLVELLKSKESWWHYMPSTWLIATDTSPEQLFDEVRGFLQSGDRILISHLSKPYQGWLPKKAWTWIHKHES